MAQAGPVQRERASTRRGRAPSYVHGASAVPLLGETIGQNLDRTVARVPDQDAVVSVHQGVRLTYARFHEAVEEIARGLMALGIEPGDRVGIWSPNNAEWVVLQYATAKMGAILVNINPAYRTSELAYALGQSGVSTLVLAPRFRQADYVAMVDEVAAEASALKRRVVLGGSRPYGYRKPPGGAPGTLELVESEAAVIRELRDRTFVGEAVMQLVADLNARNVLTASGGRWWPTTVMKILTSPRIKGVRSHHGVEYPATWPAIVSAEEFERLQVILSAGAHQLNAGRRFTSRSYLLTGWAACSGDGDDGKACGMRLLAGASKAFREREPKRRYRCVRFDSTGQEYGCGKVTRIAAPVEFMVSEAVLSRFEGEDLAALVAPDAPEELHELAASLGEDRRRLEQASRDRYRREGDPLRLEEGQFLAIQAEIKDAGVRWPVVLRSFEGRHSVEALSFTFGRRFRTLAWPPLSCGRL